MAFNLDSSARGIMDVSQQRISEDDRRAFKDLLVSDSYEHLKRKSLQELLEEVNITETQRAEYEFSGDGFTDETYGSKLTEEEFCSLTARKLLDQIMDDLIPIYDEESLVNQEVRSHYTFGTPNSQDNATNATNMGQFVS